MSKDQVIDFTVVMTSVTAMPQRLTAPFFLAATAAAEEIKVVLYFTGMGTELLKKAWLKILLLLKAGNRFVILWIRHYAMAHNIVLCKTSMDLFNITSDDVAFDLPMLTVSEALPYLANCKKIISF